MNDESQVFKSGGIRPMECLSEAWQLVKPDYWLFLGICLVGMLIGSFAQIILMGPMMCGIFLCFLNRMSGRPISFNLLFKGFDFFLPSFIAMLLMTVPALILVFGSYIVMFGGIFAIIALVRPGQGGPPGPEVPIMIFSLIGVVVLGVMFVSFALHALFMFVFPLIVDRQLSGWEALKLSSRAVWANIGGVILLILLSTALSFLGVLACYVGAILEMPLMMGLTAVAYRKVFPEVDRLREFDEIEGESEALPAQDAAPSSTEYHDREPGRGV